MLSTLHRRQEFTAGDPSHVTKFIPRFDGPYKIVNNMPEFSAYTLDLPNLPNIFPTFHTLQLKRFTENDASLFPLREHISPSPIMTSDGMEEYAIDRIIDERCRGINTLYIGLDMGPKKTDGYHNANSTIVKHWTPGKKGRGLLHDSSFFPPGFDAPIHG